MGSSCGYRSYFLSVAVKARLSMAENDAPKVVETIESGPRVWS
jgi:hypothetical protein